MRDKPFTPVENVEEINELCTMMCVHSELVSIILLYHRHIFKIIWELSEEWIMNNFCHKLWTSVKYITKKNCCKNLQMGELIITCISRWGKYSLSKITDGRSDCKFRCRLYTRERKKRAWEPILNHRRYRSLTRQNAQIQFWVLYKTGFALHKKKKIVKTCS